MRALVILLCGSCAAGGGGGGGAKSEDMAMSPGGNYDMAMSMTGGMSDAQYCDAACNKLTGACGVEFGSGCSSGCLASMVFLSCIKQANLDDCNALSLCSFVEYAHDICGGVGGVPMGSVSCNDTATCEATCNVAQPGIASCPCNCIAGLLPVSAAALLVNNQCALSKCSNECGPSGSGSACNTCAANMCATEHAQCASQ